MIVIKQGRIQGRKHKQDKEIHSLKTPKDFTPKDSDSRRSYNNYE